MSLSRKGIAFAALGAVLVVVAWRYGTAPSGSAEATEVEERLAAREQALEERIARLEADATESRADSLPIRSQGVAGEADTESPSQDIPTEEEMLAQEALTAQRLSTWFGQRLRAQGADDALAGSVVESFAEWQHAVGSEIESVECVSGVGCRTAFTHAEDQSAERVRGASHELFGWSAAGYIEATETGETIVYSVHDANQLDALINPESSDFVRGI